MERGKVTKISCGKGQCNANKAEIVSIEQERMQAQSQKIPINLYK
jgi:hypothetical protein